MFAFVSRREQDEALLSAVQTIKQTFVNMKNLIVNILISDE